MDVNGNDDKPPVKVTEFLRNQKYDNILEYFSKSVRFIFLLVKHDNTE